jgi:putative ABC transport system permease protein
VKFIPLVWAGIRRKLSRSILILLQVIIAFTLFGSLQGLSSGIKGVVAATRADRLYVGSRTALGEPLPYSTIARLETMPGVIATTFRVQFGGQYQRPGQNVPVLATEPDGFFKVYPENQPSAGAVQALHDSLDGAIVGSETMRKYRWKVGDRFTVQAPLQKKNGDRNWTFRIVGSYDNTDQPDSTVACIVNYRYVNESRATGRDTVLIATVRVDDPHNASAIGDTIDKAFANSPNETLTQSEHELAESQVSQLGDLDAVVHRVTGAAFFVLLFATGALMMQSIRERTPELAVLKTFGFPDFLVMSLILLETLLLCVTGAAIGLWIASGVMLVARSQLPALGPIPSVVIAVGFSIAVGLALAGGAIPSWRGLRLRVVDALADR